MQQLEKMLQNIVLIHLIYFKQDGSEDLHPLSPKCCFNGKEFLLITIEAFPFFVCFCFFFLTKVDNSIYSVKQLLSQMFILT